MSGFPAVYKEKQHTFTEEDVPYSEHSGPWQVSREKTHEPLYHEQWSVDVGLFLQHPDHKWKA